MTTKISTHLIALVLLSSTLLLNSCGKDGDDPKNDGGDPIVPKTNFVEAVIGTDPIDPSGLPEIDYEASTTSLEFAVFDKNQVTSLSIYIDISGPSTQSFGPNGTAFANVQTSSTTQGLYSSDGGTIVLTTNDKTNRIVEGTFNFSAKNTDNFNIDVSGGKFYIKY